MEKRKVTFASTISSNIPTKKQKSTPNYIPCLMNRGESRITSGNIPNVTDQHSIETETIGSTLMISPIERTDIILGTDTILGSNVTTIVNSTTVDTERCDVPYTIDPFEIPNPTIAHVLIDSINRDDSHLTFLSRTSCRLHDFTRTYMSFAMCAIVCLICICSTILFILYLVFFVFAITGE